MDDEISTNLTEVLARTHVSTLNYGSTYTCTDVHVQTHARAKRTTTRTTLGHSPLTNTYHANQRQSARAVRQDEDWCGEGFRRDAAARTSFAHAPVIFEVALFTHRAERARVPRGAVLLGSLGG